MAVTAGSVLNPESRSDLYHARCKWTKAIVDLWLSPATRSLMPVERSLWYDSRCLKSARTSAGVAAGAGAGGTECSGAGGTAAPPLAEDAAAGAGGATGGGENMSEKNAKLKRRWTAVATHQARVTAHQGREVDLAHGIAGKAAVPSIVSAASDAIGGGAGASAALDAA